MFKLPDLPYAYDALAKVVSDTTMHTHHDKHHKAYVDTTNKLVEEKGLGAKSMEDVVRHARQAGDQKLFNQSGQAWNHAFFWESMSPDGGQPGGDLAGAINDAFGGMDGFKEKFVAEGVGHFASGWAWLMFENGKLAITSTHDADTALVKEGTTPLLVCDVWEHAYYLDYKNLRKDFLEKWVDGVANWRFADQQFAAAKAGGPGYRYPEGSGEAQAA